MTFGTSFACFLYQVIDKKLIIEYKELPMNSTANTEIMKSDSKAMGSAKKSGSKKFKILSFLNPSKNSRVSIVESWKQILEVGKLEKFSLSSRAGRIYE